MDDKDFHAYVASVADHMPEWAYRAEDNACDGELRMAATLRHRTSSAEIWFSRDDYRKKVSARAEYGRTIGDKRETLYGDTWDARAGFSQGRDAKAVARAVLAKVAPTAIKAAVELDRIEREHADGVAAQAATIAAFNASGLLRRPIEPSRNDGLAYFYADDAHGHVDKQGAVRFDLRGLDRDKALRVLAALAG